MIYFAFGVIWTAITAIVTFGFYGNLGGEITVNGEYVTQAEFNAMLMPKIFFSLFWFIGIAMMVYGLKIVVRNLLTEVKGEITYGKVLKKYPSGTVINGTPILRADVLTYIPDTGLTQVISEDLKLEVIIAEGQYVEVKYFNGDINFNDYRATNEKNIPAHILDMLKLEGTRISKGNTIKYEDYKEELNIMNRKLNEADEPRKNFIPGEVGQKIAAKYPESSSNTPTIDEDFEDVIKFK